MISTGICRWLFLLVSLSTWTKLIESKEMRVVCYYTNWSVYRPGTAKFSPQNINPYLCTHLIYAFGGFTKENTLKPFDKYQDIEKGGYAKFTGLKTYNKNLKTMLAIGGWNEGSSRFSPMVASADRRKELVKNTVKFLRQNHFDGLDLDWEYPTFRDGGKSRDRDNYAQLVKELREEFERESEKTGRPRLLLTMAVPAGIEYINKGYDVPKLTKYLDWMNILSYDYHSAFEPAVNHHAPLYPLEEDNEYNYDADLNIDHTIKHYIKMGADPSKLVLGIPTYGRSYTLFNPDATDIGSPADGPGDMGEATRENGYLAYYEICEYVKDQDWELEEPYPDAMGPIAYKDNQWVGYDDENIVRKKAEYVAENGLGGIMFWAIDNDDFRGSCHGKPYPLIEAGKEALLNAYGITEENLISPPSKPIKPKSKSRTRSKLTNQDEKKEVSTTTVSSSTRRRRIKAKQREDPEEKPVERQTKRRNKSSRKQTAETSTYSSLKIVTPSYTTPAPPSTPDVGGAFKCEDEGFFPHPKDCKKYFWCLSGAGDSGIIAHQFTCPAGLYFNKAADSCDYSQNVLCNKKLQKASASTTTTEEPAEASPKSTPSSLFSTSRAPPKITAATSKTTFRQSTTTEAYEEEYEDEEDEDINDEKADSEEDPRVIKELLDLIKKAGGIEQLEKHLNFGTSDVSSSTSSSGIDSSTKSSITKSLYERVLSKTSKSTLDALKKTSVVNRNSRGPQNVNLKKDNEDRKKVDRGRLEYKTISRQRPTTEKSTEDEEENLDDEEEVVEEKSSPKRLFKTKSSPEYTNIRRARVSSTPEPNEQSNFSRNKILGEVDDDETDDVEDSDTNNNEASEKASTPQYVNIRRQRPSTTEGPTTLKYKDIRRRTTSKPEENVVEDTDNENKKERGSTTSSSVVEGATSKYQTIRRGSTTQATNIENNVSEKRTRGTTVSSTPISSTQDTNNSRYVIFSRGTTAASNTDDENEVTAKYQTVSRSSSTASSSVSSTSEGINKTSTTTENPFSHSYQENITITSETPIATESLLSFNNNITSEFNKSQTQSETSSADKSILNNSQKNSNEILYENKKQTTVLLNQPRPFSHVTTSEPSSTTENSKVSQTNFKSRLRPKTASSETQTTSTTPASTTVKTTRIRGSSRFNLGNRNRNNAVENNDVNKPSATNVVRARKRYSTTTEKSVDFNEEQNRAYRPSDLADFSSLTAVDFSKGKEIDPVTSRQRRRRPIASTTATSTTTEKTDASLKTGSRTLPLARKLLDKTTFGRSRRVNTNKIEDQVKAGSELNTASTTKHVRGFRSTTPKTVDDVPKRTRSFGRSKEVEIVPNNNTVVENSSPRTRRIIRRFRTTTPNTVTQNSNHTDQIATTTRHNLFRSRQNENELSPLDTNKDDIQPDNALQKLFNKKRLPFNRTKLNDTDTDKNSVEVSSDSAEEEEDENIKLSESNIRESSDLNSFDVESKLRGQFFKVKPKEDSFYGKGYSIDDTKSNKDSTTQTEEVSKPTDPSVVVRRKLIRKYRPQETSETSEASTSEPKNSETQGRRRKIIRRVRPASTSANKLETEESVEDKSTTNKRLHIRGRPTSVTSRTTTTEIVEEEVIAPKRIYRPSYYSKPTEEEPEDSHVASSTPDISIENMNEDDAVDNDNEEQDEGEEEEESTTDHGENEDGEEPHYMTILKSTSINRSHHFESNTNFENENEEGGDEDTKDKDKLVSKVVNSMVHAKNESETFVDDENTIANVANNKNAETATGDAKDIEVKKEVNEKVNETTTKRNALLKPQKERPTFSRQKLVINKQETVKELQTDNLQSVPRYRTLSRSSLTTATTITPGISESYDVSNDVGSSETTESILDTAPITQNSLTNDKSFSTESSNPITTELSNEISKYTTDSDEVLTTNEIAFKEAVTPSGSLFEETTNYFTDSTFEDVAETTTEAGIKKDIENTKSSATEKSTEHYRRSTLRSVENRPRLNLGRRPQTTSTTESSASEPTKRIYRIRDKFSRNRQQKPTSTTETEDALVRSSTSAVPVNRFILGRYSTNERSRFKPKLNKDKETEDAGAVETVEEEEIPGKERDIENEKTGGENPFSRPSFVLKPRFGQSSTRKPYVLNTPSSNKFKKQKVVNKPSFIRTSSETPSETELENVDTEAVKNRNKNLFTKRIMNTPFAGTVSTPSSTEAALTESSVILTTENVAVENGLEATTAESTTKTSKTEQTTEMLTTLHHIFAEVSNSNNITGPSTEPSNLITTSAKGKIERIIEVNRIVEVNSKEDKFVNHTKIDEPQSKIKTVPTYDKIGEVTRVTVIKVVEGNGTNSTFIETPLETNEIKTQPIDGPFIPATVVEVPASEIQKIINLTDISLKLKMQEDNKETQRQDRKFELHNQNQNSIQVTNSGKADIIDGRSHINIVTPKPFYTTETSTIALQALFPHGSSTSKNSVENFHSNDELLETERSEYVNVRVLHQDKNVRLDKGIRDDTNILPIRVLKQDEEEVTMRAHVVEVKPEPNSGTIRIVPIRVEMSRKLDVSPLVFNRVQNAVPLVRNFNVGTQFIKPELVT